MNRYPYIYTLSFLLSVRNVVLMVSSLCTIALPRLPQHTLHFKAVEELWYRWESRVSFAGYSLCMALILFLQDHHMVVKTNCSVLVSKSSFIIPLVCSIFVLGLINLVIVELYIKCGKHLLFSENKLNIK